MLVLGDRRVVSGEYLQSNICFKFRARRVIYRFAFEAWSERDTINRGSAIKR